MPSLCVIPVNWTQLSSDAILYVDAAHSKSNQPDRGGVGLVIVDEKKLIGYAATVAANNSSEAEILGISFALRFIRIRGYKNATIFCDNMGAITKSYVPVSKENGTNSYLDSISMLNANYMTAHTDIKIRYVSKAAAIPAHVVADYLSRCYLRTAYAPCLVYDAMTSSFDPSRYGLFGDYKRRVQGLSASPSLNHRPTSLRDHDVFSEVPITTYIHVFDRGSGVMIGVILYWWRGGAESYMFSTNTTSEHVVFLMSVIFTLSQIGFCGSGIRIICDKLAWLTLVEAPTHVKLTGSSAMKKLSQHVLSLLSLHKKVSFAFPLSGREKALNEVNKQLPKFTLTAADCSIVPDFLTMQTLLYPTRELLYSRYRSSFAAFLLTQTIVKPIDIDLHVVKFLLEKDCTTATEIRNPQSVPGDNGMSTNGTSPAVTTSASYTCWRCTSLATADSRTHSVSWAHDSVMNRKNIDEHGIAVRHRAGTKYCTSCPLSSKGSLYRNTKSRLRKFLTYEDAIVITTMVDPEELSRSAFTEWYLNQCGDAGAPSIFECRHRSGTCEYRQNVGALVLRQELRSHLARAAAAYADYLRKCPTYHKGHKERRRCFRHESGSAHTSLIHCVRRGLSSCKTYLSSFIYDQQQVQAVDCIATGWSDDHYGECSMEVLASCARCNVLSDTFAQLYEPVRLFYYTPGAIHSPLSTSSSEGFTGSHLLGSIIHERRHEHGQLLQVADGLTKNSKTLWQMEQPLLCEMNRKLLENVVSSSQFGLTEFLRSTGKAQPMNQKNARQNNMNAENICCKNMLGKDCDDVNG